MSQGKEYEALHRKSSRQDAWHLQRRREIRQEDEDRMSAQAKAKKEKTIQAKLEISQEGDEHEQQADLIAKKVVNDEDANVNQLSPASLTVQSKPENGAMQASDQLQAKLESSKGSGEAIDDATKGEMETKMGTDFSEVKIHTDAHASEMSESINAKAFTHGQDVYFKRENYNPSSNEGKELLAHELTHTVQQKSGVRRKIQRGPDDKKKLVGGIEIYKQDLSDAIFKGILGDRYDSIRKSPYLSIKAEHLWVLYFKDGNEPLEKANELRTGFAETEAHLKLDKHFYEATFDTFKAEKNFFDDPADPGIKFNFSTSLHALSLTLDGKEPTFDLLKFDAEFSYDINKDNIDTQYGFIKEILQDAKYSNDRSLYQDIAEGKKTIKGKLTFSIGAQLKALAKYLKDLDLKKSKQTEKEKHESSEKEHREKSNEAKNRKNDLLDEKNKLDNELTQNKNELKRLKKSSNPSPADQQRIAELEEEIAQQEARSKELKTAYDAEKQAMQDTQKAANEERKMAKTLSREIKQLEKDAAKYEKSFTDRLKNITKKFRDKLEKVEERILTKTATYVEEKLVKWVGREIAEHIIEAVAYAIPVIGEILMIIDVALLIWDVAELIYEYRHEIWNWMKETAKKVAMLVVKTIEKVIDYILHPLNLIKDIAKGLKKMWDAFKNFFERKPGSGGSGDGNKGTDGSSSDSQTGTSDTNTGTHTGTTGTETTTETSGTNTGTTSGTNTGTTTGTSGTNTSTTVGSGTTTSTSGGTTTGTSTTATDATTTSTTSSTTTSTTSTTSDNNPPISHTDKSNPPNTLPEVVITADKTKQQQQGNIKTEVGQTTTYTNPPQNNPVDLLGYVIIGLNFDNLKVGQTIYTSQLYVFYLENGIEKNYSFDKQIKLIVNEKNADNILFLMENECAVKLKSGHVHYYHTNHPIRIYRVNFH